jgi:chromatin structure-remodeling complex protein RSC7
VRRQRLHGVYDIHTNQMHYPAIMQPTHARIVQVNDGDEPEQQSPSTSLLQPVKPAVSRNFLIMDTHLQTPPAGITPSAYDVPLRTSPADRALSAQADLLSSFKGLGAVSDDIRDLLPEDCRRAFDAARGKEHEWFSHWGDEATHACRREPIVDKAIVPYTMML